MSWRNAAPISKELVISYLLTGLAALFAIIMHEVSHGLAANALGDNTAKERGRLSLNPLRHIDVFGLIMLIVAGFGWAKPVPVDTRRLSKPRRDMCLVALAGPGMNFLMAAAAWLVYGFSYILGGTGASASYAGMIWLSFLERLAVINVGLGVFNLFPIPPLDGSKALGILLPEHLYYGMLRYERYGMLVLVALLMSGLLDKPLGFLRDAVGGLLMSAGLWLPGLIYGMMGAG